IGQATHPALFMVDTISSLASIDYRHDEWGVDVTVGGSQKGLMLPPGLSFNAVSEKALHASRAARLPRSYWGWAEILESNKKGYWPGAACDKFSFGLAGGARSAAEEGFPNGFGGPRPPRRSDAPRRSRLEPRAALR